MPDQDAWGMMRFPRLRHQRRYEVTGLDRIFTSKREAFRQAKNLARAAQASIMVYELEPETQTYVPIGEEK